MPVPRNRSWLRGAGRGLEGGQQQAEGGVRVFGLGGCFDGSDDVSKHRGLSIVEAEPKLQSTREGRVARGLRLVLATPDPQRDRIGQRALFGLESVELELAEG